MSETTEGATVAVHGCGCLLVVAIVTLGIVYVAVHFIVKYW